MDTKKIKRTVADTVSLIIRVATTPNTMAFLLLTVLQLVKPDSFKNFLHYVMAVSFLGILPVLAYPISTLLPKFKKDERNTSRNLAIIFSVSGYILGFLFAIISGGAFIETVIYMTYLISGIMTALCSFAFKIKTSGHSCGISGPIAVLVAFVSPYWLFALSILGITVWSSIKLKRHTPTQLAVGALIPVIAMFVSIYFVGLFA